MLTEQPAVYVENLSKSFRKRQILNNVNLSVPKGECYGIIGPNGSGKSTLLRCLTGLVRPNSGVVTVLGTEVFPARVSLPKGVGALIETPGFMGNMSGRNNLRFLMSISGKVDDKKIDKIMQTVGLDPYNPQKVRSYSTGMRQRLGIAQAILDEPELLLLDEPQHGLDPEGIIEIRELLRNFNRQGTTILMVSHQLEEIEELCRRVYRMHGGTLSEVKKAVTLDMQKDRGEPH